MGIRMAIAAALLAGACGKDDGTVHASCKQGNVCEDYTSKAKEYIDGREKDCKALSGEWKLESCPSGDLVGTCTSSTDASVRRYYKGGATPFTPEVAAAACEHEAHGTFTPAK